MIREINISDTEAIQKICKTALGYDVDISTVSNQIKKLSCDNKNHILAVYEDENTVIINKPAGLLSQKAQANDISVNDLLLEYLDFDETALNTFKPSICNRLDRNTSGLLVCGKTLEGLRVNNELIKNEVRVK